MSNSIDSIWCIQHQCTINCLDLTVRIPVVPVTVPTVIINFIHRNMQVNLLLSYPPALKKTSPYHKESLKKLLPYHCNECRWHSYKIKN